MDESTSITIGIMVGLPVGILLGFLAGWVLHDLLGEKESEFGSVQVVRDEKGLPISYEVVPVGQLLKKK